MRFPVFAAVLFAAGAAQAQVTVSQAWVRETIGAGRTSAGYARIVNTGLADRLIAVSVPSGTAEIHESRDQGGMMRMLPVKFLDVPASGEAVLTPGGYHIMIMNAPLKRGETVDVTFTFEKAGKITVAAKIAPISATSAP